MAAFLDSAIFILIRILVFFVPIILLPFTSELFEFNKIILVYILTILIVGSWAAKMILQRKFIFRRTILDIPLLLFLFSQIVSTIASFDSRTSFLGYYSRFNGGLASLLCYSLLYWAWVANIDAKKTLKALKFFLASAGLVSLYGILEHFGIDKDIWVQDVTARVFSTLGQPNWLAAWLVAIIPITWTLALKARGFKTRGFWLWSLASFVFFLTILFTKSRSGLLGLGVAALVFWGLSYTKKRQKAFLALSSIIVATALIVGTPWSPSLVKVISRQPIPQYSLTGGTALEGGGTESGTIRQIVWKGALNVWRHHPLIGTGVETFAYSFYNFRPIEHNLVSEWDFLYNKAHNEYLNIMANTGTLGIAAYLAVVFFSIVLMLRSKSEYHLAFLAGYASLLATNFFGFSVVPTSLLFFLFPAFAVSLAGKQIATVQEPKKLNTKQKALAAFLVLITGWLLIAVGRYWYADTLFAKGKALNDAGRFVEARGKLVKAVVLSRRESIFWDEISQASSGIALALWETKDEAKAREFADTAIKESAAATALSPKNVNLLRNRASMYIKLAAIDKTYLIRAIDTVMEAIVLAPTDAKLYYNLGLTYLRMGENDKAIETFERTIAMKPDYRDARLAYALMLVDMGQRQKAIEEMEYILARIDPNDSVVKDQLQELTNK
jgi:tetratricopeptide (TPR) repeat protein